MANVINVGREVDPVVDSVTGAPVGISVGTVSNVFGTANFGGSGVAMTSEGVLSAQASAAGIQPGATAADKVLAVFSIPAGSFDVAGRRVVVNAIGSFGATGNNKTVKIIFNPSAAVVGSTVTGGTTVASSGVVATNGGQFAIGATITKVGAAGANTQISTSSGISTTAPVTNLTATESGAILIAVTGNAATATTDITLNTFTVIGSN